MPHGEGLDHPGLEPEKDLKPREPKQSEQPQQQFGVPPLRSNLPTQFNFEDLWGILEQKLSPEGYKSMIGQGPAPYLAEGFHPPESWARSFFNYQANRELQGLKNVTGPDWGPVSQFVTSRLGYSPTYWEDPQRVAKWYHTLQSLPAGAPPPDWVDPARLTAAYKYFEQKYEGKPWWEWKFLAPTDPARQFLQGFDMPPQDLLRPSELIYRPGEALEETEASTIPVPGSEAWHELDIWQKVAVIVLGSGGPTIGEAFNLPGAGGGFDVGVSRFARGAAKAAPLGFGIGFFGGGGPLSPLSALGLGFSAALVTGAAGGAAEVGLGAIQERRDLGREVTLGGFNYDVTLEKALVGLLGLLQYPVDLLERAGGTAGQIYLSMSDPDRYGPVSEVFKGIEIEFPTAFTPSEVGPQGPLIPLLQIGGPTGEAAALAFETAPTMTWIVNMLEHLSYNLDHIFYEGTEEITLAKPDEVWDLGATTPRKVGPADLKTEGAVWAWAVTDARRELMGGDMAPRDARLVIGERYGISGILSDLFLQAVLDPLNFTPMAEVRLARVASVEAPKGLSRLAQPILRRALRIGEPEAAALRAALEHLPPGSGLNLEDLKDVRGLRSAGGYVRAAMQVGGKDVIESLANILRTMDDFGRPEVISGMGRFARYLGGVDAEGKPIDLDEPTGFLGRLWGLTPKSRALSFMGRSSDLFKLVLNYSDDPNTMAQMLTRLSKAPADVAQELGLRFLQSPDAHYPLLMLRDFDVEKIDAFLEPWNRNSRQRRVLSRLTEVLGNETDTATITQLRDFGDSAWQRVLAEVQRGIAEGDESAQAFYNMIEQGMISKSLLEADLKALLNGDIPYHADHIRAQMLDALLDHSTDWAVRNFNVKVENQVYRFSNALKQAASIVLLDGNPGYFFANFWNNVATTAFDGVLGLRRKATLFHWWYEFGMTPNKLDQAFGGPGQISETGRSVVEGMDLATAIEEGIEPQMWARIQAEAAGGRFGQKISSKARGEGPITVLDRFFAGFRNKPGQKGVGRFSPLVFSKLSHWVEQWSSANAMTKGAQEWWGRSWRRGKGYSTMPGHVADALGPDLANKIYGMIEGTLRFEDIEANLLGEAELEPRIEQFVEQAASTLRGKGPEDILQILHETDAIEFLSSELADAKTADDVRLAFDAMDRKVQQQINAVHADEVKMMAAEVIEQVKAGDFTGMLDTWLTLNQRLEEWWTSHVLNWSRTVEEADTLFDAGNESAADSMYQTRMAEARSDAQRMMDMQTAVIDGMVDGMVESVEGASRSDFVKYTLGLRTQLAEWQSFFDLRDRLWIEYGDARKEGTLEPGQYQETYQRISFEYDERIRDTIDLQQQMDQAVIDYVHRINPEAAEALAPMLDDIRDHQIKMYQHEAAVRDANYDIWGAKDGRAVAATLRRVMGDYPELLLTYEQFIRSIARRGDLTSKDIAVIRRQVYEIWVDEVKLQHIRDYYQMRGRGMVEVLGGEPGPETQPPQVKPIEQPTVDAQRLGLEVDAQRLEELTAEGVDPAEASRIAATEAAAARVNVDLSRRVTLDELRMIAKDAGISTATKQGRATDAHLLNVLNKDLGLEGDLKLRRLSDLADLAGTQGEDVMVAARQVLVNRAVKKSQMRQQANLTGMSVEALETLEGGLDQVGLRKLRRIATDNGLTEANLMPKEHIWSWLDARARRLDPVPFEAATPEHLLSVLREMVADTGASNQQVLAYGRLLEARAKAIGMSLAEYVARRYGLDSQETIYAFSQMGVEHPWVADLKAAADQLALEAKVFHGEGAEADMFSAFLTRDAEIVVVPDHDTAAHRIGTTVHPLLTETGTIRVRKLYGRVYDFDIRGPVSEAQVRWMRGRLKEALAARVEYYDPNAPPANRYVVGHFDGVDRMEDALRFLDVARRKVVGGDEIGGRYDGMTVQEMLRAKADERAGGELGFGGGEGRLYQNPGDSHYRPLRSWLERVVEQKMPESMPADELLNFLNKSGVKQDELKFSLLPELIEQRGPDAVFTKDEVLALTRDMQTQIKTVHIPTKRQPVELLSIGWDSQPSLERGLTMREGETVATARQFEVLRGTTRVVDDSRSRVQFRIKQMRSGQTVSEGGTLRSPTNIDANGYIVEYEMQGTARNIDVGPEWHGQLGYNTVFPTLEEAKAFAETVRFETLTRDARWRQYTYPGGENYQELVFHLPDRTGTRQQYLDAIDDAIVTHQRDAGVRESIQEMARLRREVGERPEGLPLDALDTPLNSLGYGLARTLFYDRSPEIQFAFDRLEAWARTVLGTEADLTAGALAEANFSSDPHYSEPNVLGWGRTTDRYLPDGRRVKLIEELQSDVFSDFRTVRKAQRIWDLAQERTAVNAEMQARIDAGLERGGVTSEFEALGERADQLQGQMESLFADVEGSPGFPSLDRLVAQGRPDDPPFLPFEKNWWELVVKQLLADAAKEGYDGIMLNDPSGVWVAETGGRFGDFDDVEALAARSEEVLARVFEVIELRQLEPGYYEFFARTTEGEEFGSVGPYGAIAHDAGLEGIHLDRVGLFELSSSYTDPLNALEPGGEPLVARDVPAAMDLADAATEDLQAVQMARGMREFYGTMVPASMRKIAKQVGSTATNAEFLGIEPRFTVKWPLPTTPESQVEGLHRISLDVIGEQLGGQVEWRGELEVRGGGGGIPGRVEVDLNDMVGLTGEDLDTYATTLEVQLRNDGVGYDAALGVARRVHSRIQKGQPAPGLLIEINDAVREAALGGEFRLFQETNEKAIVQTELRARQALVKAINESDLPLGPLDLQRVLNGEPLSEVFAKVPEIPEGVFGAYETWRAALQDSQWLDSQHRMLQGPKGSIEIGRDGRAIIRALRNPDFSTGLHELGHLFRLDLIPSEMEVVRDWVRGQGVEVDVIEGRFTGDGDAPRRAEELFARGFERYVAEGVAPTEGLRAVFEKMKQWIIQVYRSIVGSDIDIELSQEMRDLFSDMLGGRAPDFSADEVTWQKIQADAQLEGRPRVPLGDAETVAAGLAVEAPLPSDLPGLAGSLEIGRSPSDPNVFYPLRYRVMSLNDPRVSHTLGGSLTEGFPKELQPRDRSRAASIRQSETMAANLNADVLVAQSNRIDDGSPIIGQSGNVLSGNGRMNALRIAARDFPELYAQYKRAVVEALRSQDYGAFPADQIPENPVLVRELLPGQNEVEFARVANEPATMAMSPAEQARLDVSRLSEQMLARLEIGENQTAQEAVLAAANRDFVRAFVDQLPRAEQAEVMTRGGELSARGLNRMLQAIFMYVWGDDAATMRVAEMVFESTDPVIRNTTNAMMHVAADMAKVKSLIEAGRRPETLDITGDVIAAVDQLARLKLEGTRIEDFAQQTVLEGFGGGLDEFQTKIMLDLETSKRSAKAIRNLLKQYADLVQQQPEIGQTGLFGETEYPSRADLYDRAKAANAPPTDDQTVLFQAPSQPKLAFDQIPPTMETAAKMSEGYQQIRPVLDAMRETMAGADGWVQRPRMDDVRQRLDPNAQTDFANWVKSLRGDMSSSKFSSMKWGERKRDFALLDYTKQRGADIGLGVLSNYPFWPTRTILRWLIRSGNFPILMATYAKINEARRKMERSPGFPSRLQGKVYLPLPFLPEWMGGGLWIDPVRTFFPPHMFMDTFDRIALEQNRTSKRAAYIIEKWAEDGQVDKVAALDAIQTQEGELWKLATDEAAAQMELEFSDPLDYVELLTGVSLPVDIAHEFIRGTPERISPLPLTRYTKTLTSAVSQATGIGDPAGVNIEAPLRRMAGMPDWDRFEDYRFDRMLSNMVGDDPSLMREAMIAMQERQGPLWDESVRRTNSARNHGVYANPLWWVFGMGGDTFPTGEGAQRALSEEFSRAYTARDVGDYEAVGKFWDKYPEYKVRLASFDTPEERMRFFLVDEVWVRYMELGSANKELVRLQLGKDFEDMFLSKETRSYPDIPLETLASWAQAIGGYVPDDAENRIEVKDLLPPLLQLPPDAADVIDTYRQERNDKFPNWFAVQQGYFAFPPGSDERKKYAKAQWPWTLEDYWDWRKGELESKPLLDAYYRRYDLENDDTGSLGSLRVPEILTNPILMRQLEASLYADQPLTSGALEELRRIWELMGQPGEFKEWIKKLDLTPEPAGGQQQTYPTGGG